MGGKKFPDGFLWGASTASYQVEGNIDSCDWAEAARNGKVPPAGLACDHYNRYEEDFDIAKSLNMNAQRISIEWARVEPEEGVFDEKELDHYKQVVRALRDRGMEPFVTIWHWTMPTWLSDKGGITYKRWPELLARYGAKVAEHLGSDVNFYMTINEPMVVTGNGYIPGIWPPFKMNPFAYLRAVSNVIKGHTLCYAAVKKVAPHTNIGVAKNIVPARGTNPIGSFLATIGSWWYNDRYLKKTKDHHDFIGLNHYFGFVLWRSKKEQRKIQKNDLNWDLYPPSIYDALMLLKKYNKPVYITEHGLADGKDQYREWFLKESLREIHKAIQNDIDVRGYLHWSLLDNYEWAEGYSPRFGLIEIDYENNQTRKVRESAKAYAEICKHNAV